MKTAVMIALACLAYGMTSTPGFAASYQGVDPVKTVRQKFEAFNRHDASTIEGIYATDAILHSPDYPELAGNSRIADTYRGLFDAIPDANDNVQNIDSSGDRVYAQFVLSGHLKGTGGKFVKVPIISVYTVRDGHIVADSTYYDRKTP
ncbi:MAG: nuclear transport factor 2 family protein [Rhodanobacter sp.]